MQDSKNKMVRAWIRRGGFLAALLVVFIISGYILDPVRLNMPGQASEDYRFMDYYMQEENDIDILVMGDSESLTMVSPVEMWTQRGYACFIAGQPGQYIESTYYNLKKILKKKKPELIILEAHGTVKGSNNLALGEVKNALSQHVFPILKNHNMWKPLVTGNVKKFPVHFNGFELRMGVSPWEGGPVAIEPCDEQVSPVSKVYLKKVKKLCDENDVALLLVSTPSVLNYNDAAVSNLTACAAACGIDYIDLNSMNDQIGIDWSRDTMDQGDHLNYDGTMKVTEYMIAFIDNNYVIPDRRGETPYSGWNQEIEALYEEIQNGDKR